MDPTADWALLPRLIALAGVGRLLLALLPAGEPGGGRPRELPAVLAASLVLGLLGFLTSVTVSRFIERGGG